MTIRCFNDFLADIYKQKKTDKTYLDSLNELKVSDWMSLADQYGEYCRLALTLPDVVSTLCDCKKHSMKTGYGFKICTKCGNEFDD